MDSIKRIILFRIPMSICNFRCHYCYLAQRDESYQGIQPVMQYTPKQVREAMSLSRLGGHAYMNFCADGETLLVKDIDKYVYELADEGHYIEIVSNMTISSVLDKILSLDKNHLSHIEFKCSLHYLELKKKNLLEVFANNVNRAWRSGASINIEVTPSDELIPFIDGLKEYSLGNFGALPHLTIARNDRTEGIDYLTNLSMDEYDKIWSQFDSDFWSFKKTIFGVQQKRYCYAGLWSLYVDLSSGDTMPCYCGRPLKNVFKHPDKPIDYQPIGDCPIAHCYNGHALLTLGTIPDATNVRYGDIRDRVRLDGTHWLQPELKTFFNTKLSCNNAEISSCEKCKYKIKNLMSIGLQLPLRVVRKIKRSINKNPNN